MTSLLKGFRWNITTQVIIAVSSLVAVPVAIHRLGLAAYGAFTLAMTGVNLLQQLDGGMMSAALRYMGLAAGREDRHRAAMLLTTLLLVVAAIGSAFGVAVFLAAPELVRAFGITPPCVDQPSLLRELLGSCSLWGCSRGCYPLLCRQTGDTARLVSTTWAGDLCTWRVSSRSFTGTMDCVR
jgi:hypothetical protein